MIELDKKHIELINYLLYEPNQTVNLEDYFEGKFKLKSYMTLH